MINIKSAIVAITFVVSTLFSQLSLAEPVWIDVRTLEENKANGIEGDPLISYTNIVKEVSQLYPDKETDIHLYCRSGRRAGVALSSLKAAGYNNVHNEGSIGNARKIRAASK